MAQLSTKKSLNLDAAKAIGNAAEAKARELNFTNCIAVIDDGGRYHRPERPQEEHREEKNKRGNQHQGCESIPCGSLAHAASTVQSRGSKDATTGAPTAQSPMSLSRRATKAISPLASCTRIWSP